MTFEIIRWLTGILERLEESLENTLQMGKTACENTQGRRWHRSFKKGRSMRYRRKFKESNRRTRWWGGPGVVQPRLCLVLSVIDLSLWVSEAFPFWIPITSLGRPVHFFPWFFFPFTRPGSLLKWTLKVATNPNCDNLLTDRWLNKVHLTLQISKA